MVYMIGHDVGDFDSDTLEEQDTSTFGAKTDSLNAKTETQYTSIGAANTVPEDEDDIPLSSEYDPDEDYVRNFERLGWHGATGVPQGTGVSLEGLEKMAAEIDETLTSCVSDGNSTPRSLVNTCFQQYNTCICSTKDLEKKSDYIKRYELHKFEFDDDNEEDKEKAELYLSNARNTAVKARVRLEHYQIAIKFTNNVAAKQKLKEEYRRYAFSISSRS